MPVFAEIVRWICFPGGWWWGRIPRYCHLPERACVRFG